MQRKEFELVAHVICNTFDDAKARGELVTRASMAERFAYELARTNAAFDRPRFLAACGVNAR